MRAKRANKGQKGAKRVNKGRQHCIFVFLGDLGIGRQRVLTKAGLSAQDCLFMGKHCFNSGALARSLEWFEEAWVMAGNEGNKTLRQDQVQKFLDHAAKVHDSKVMKGEKSTDLFPKPVYEESPFDQREKIIKEAKDKFQENITSLVRFDSYDIPRYNALCRGEELRVSLKILKNEYIFLWSQFNSAPWW